MPAVEITEDNLTLFVSENTTAVLDLWGSWCEPSQGAKTQADITVVKGYPQARHTRAAQREEATR
ncbi:YbbN family protein [Corynebacterium deserti]|nr:hypothetical protein [Corynebacterium deserti]